MRGGLAAARTRGFVPVGLEQWSSANSRMCWTRIKSMMGCLQRKKSSHENVGNEKKGQTFEKSDKEVVKEKGELVNQQEELERETKTEEMQKKYIT